MAHFSFFSIAWSLSSIDHSSPRRYLTLVMLVARLTAPFRAYNDLLERRPLLTKCLTSGVMYASGDVIAQFTETYNANRGKPADQQVSTVLDRKRIAVFFIYGAGIGGPSYHYWFNYLNTLPELLWRLKQSRQRGQILRAYAFLKAHNIEVKLDLTKLPKAAPLSKWKGKAAKIAADQLIFSSLYTLTFFFGIGLLTGAADRMELIYSSEDDPKLLTPKTSINSSDPTYAEIVSKLKQHIKDEARRASEDSDDHPTTDPDPSEDDEDLVESEKLINLMIHKIRIQQQINSQSLGWSEIWQRTWQHTKAVYIETYIADCIIWPPLQLINFSFVPLRYQFLFVNVANLAWNTFLSLMANKKH